MKQSYLVLLALIFLPISLHAQEKVEDVVYLKNGSIIRGEIIELNDGEYLKIETAGRNIFVFNMDDVDNIRLEEVPNEHYFKSSGYMSRSGIDIMQSNNSSTPRFYTVHGKQFTPQFGAGFGIGITPYNDPLMLIPFYVDMNLRLVKANVSPFLALKTGYNFSYHDDESIIFNNHRGGLLFNPSFGMQFNLSNGFGWFINAGYNIDNSSYSFDQWGNRNVSTELSFRRINFGLGVSF